MCDGLPDDPSDEGKKLGFVNEDDCDSKAGSRSPVAAELNAGAEGFVDEGAGVRPELIDGPVIGTLFGFAIQDSIALGTPGLLPQGDIEHVCSSHALM